MPRERQQRVETSILDHLRRAGEPVREAYLYERVRADVPGALSGEDFITILLRLELGGHVHIDPARDDEVRDPAPFQPRFWRVAR